LRHFRPHNATGQACGWPFGIDYCAHAKGLKWVQGFTARIAVISTEMRLGGVINRASALILGVLFQAHGLNASIPSAILQKVHR
jgi:hypothetical protein